MSMNGFARTAAAIASVALTLAILTAPTSAAAPDRPGPSPDRVTGNEQVEVQRIPSVPGRAVPGSPGDRRDPDVSALPQPAAEWPDDSSTTVELPAPGIARRPTPIPAGDLPVRLAPVRGEGPLLVAVEQRRAGGRPNGLRVDLRPEGALTDGHPRTVDLTVDTSSIRTAFGGDWATRLRLFPADAQGRPTSSALAAVTADHLLTATVHVADSGSTYVVAADPQGPAGSYAATSLAPAGTWQVDGQSGSFAWQYPLGVPAVPGGLEPDLSLSYSSSAVDGHTVSTNNQSSWLGDGWALWSGYVERSYKACADDPGGNNGQQVTGDLCWGTQNATLSLGGRSTPLVSDDGVWRAQDDDGSRIERIARPGQGIGDDADGEYWRVTTTDGVQYYFGLEQVGAATTDATWAVPVFGNHAGEPCHQAAFAASACQQAYRWNLDRIVDPHGNTLTFFYSKESARYAQNMGETTAPYTRGGTLDRIEYGTRLGSADQAPARVVFTTADRCATTSGCAEHDGTHWPDVPWEQHCSAAPCTGQVSPTFWSTKRLAAVSAQVATSGSSYRTVDRWAFAQTYPDPGDGTSPSLWLDSITRTGSLTASPLSLPAVTFDGELLPNRVDATHDRWPGLYRRRIDTITNEAGGQTSIDYADADCAPGSLPTSAATNTRLCFPVNWAMPPATTPEPDWFHKYVVASVTEDDAVAGGDDMVSSYIYSGGGAWAYDDDPLIPETKRTWSQWRGFAKVTVREGWATSESDETLRETVTRYFRGMHGDRTATGGTKEASVVDSTGEEVLDREPLAGLLREVEVFNGVDGPRINSRIDDPWTRLTASQGTLEAYQVEVGSSSTRTRLANGTDRRTEVDTTYDRYGNATVVDDHGDVDEQGDERCTRTGFVHNATHMLVSFPSHERTVAAACGSTPQLPEQAISEVRYGYDEQDLGHEPTQGDLTRTDQVKAYPGGAPEYFTVEETDVDAYGRATKSVNPLGEETLTEYVEEAGLTTATSTTNPLGQTSTTTLDPASGLVTKETDLNGRVTRSEYDALGRLTSVWFPGRDPDAGDSANLRYTYTVRKATSTEPSVIRTDTLKANGNAVASYQLLDGFLRLRQTQAPSPVGSGRIITDTLRNARGLVELVRDPYYNNEGPAGGTLFSPDPALVPSATATSYDGAGREVEVAHLEKNDEKWNSTFEYGGDYVQTTPPPGGTASRTYRDARGRTTALLQFHGDPGDDAPADRTEYTYTPSGQLASLMDPAGNVWRYQYDVLGRPIEADDPDKGVTTTTYDDAGQIESATDARGQSVFVEHDAIGRVTKTRLGSATGTVLTEREYDSLDGGKGLLTSATRWIDGHKYVTSVTGYDESGRPTGESVIIPGNEEGLAGTYTTSATYMQDGSPQSTTLPELGDLAQETLNHGYDATGLPYSMRSALTTYVAMTRYNGLGDVAFTESGTSTRKVIRTLHYDPGTRRVIRSALERNYPVRGLVNDFAYDYDPVGNVTSITERTVGSVTDNQCFDYDHLRRTTQVWTAADECEADPTSNNISGPAPYWVEFDYDATGNRRTMTQKGFAGSSDVTTTYDYPAPGDEVVRPHALTKRTTDGTSDSYDYDASGNMTSRPGTHGLQKLEWGADGLLSHISDGSGETKYVYDADGSVLLTRNEDATTLFLSSGEVRLDHSTGAATGTRYYPGVGTRTKSKFVWTSADHHGTSGVTLSSGLTSVQVRRFDLFGNARGASQPWSGGSQGFVGGAPNAQTGLTRLGAREYDPTIGRFISVDPVIDPAEPQQLNAYSYANNNPASMSDPTGLRYMEGDTGWTEVRPRPKSRPRPQKPSYHLPARSTAPFNDPGARCEGGSGWCRDMTTAQETDDRAIRKERDGWDPSDLDTYYSDSLGRLPLTTACHSVGEWGNTLGECTDAQMTRAELLIGLHKRDNSGTAKFVKFLYDLTPVADVHHCLDGSQSCWWIAANLNPFAKAAKVAKAAANLTEAASSGKRVFWSGGNVAKTAAADYAKANGAKTLDMTWTGQTLQRMPQGLVPRKAWDVASGRFARGAQGEAHVFFGPGAPSPTSTFARIEAPILHRQGNPIMQHYLEGP